MGSLFGGGDSPEPDPEIAAAAHRNVQIGQDWISFARDAYNEGKSRQKGIDQTADTVARNQLGISDAANDSYMRIMDRYKNLFEPVQDRIVADANSWDSSENQAAAAAKAKADVLRERAAADGSNVRQMAAYGISPVSGRFTGIKRANDLDTSVASVGAQNNARDTLKLQGNQLRTQAAQLGINTMGIAANDAQIANVAGSSGLGAKVTAGTSNMQNNNQMSQGFGGAMTGNNTSAQILNSDFNNQLGAYGQNQAGAAAGMQGIGTLAAAAATAY